MLPACLYIHWAMKPEGTCFQNHPSHHPAILSVHGVRHGCLWVSGMPGERLAWLEMEKQAGQTATDVDGGEDVHTDKGGV